MGKKLIINCDSREVRIGLVENNRLVEVHIQKPVNQRVVGNIYKGRVSNVLPGIQAAFIDVGLDKNAFLYINDAIPADLGADTSPVADVTITDLIKQGQEVLVQVIKEPFGTKGARVSTNINIPGRYVVLMPFTNFIGVSRKINSETERTRLKAIGEELLEKHQMGMIIRTVANSVDEKQIQLDYEYVVGIWQVVQEAIKKSKTPSKVYRDLEIVPRVIRDVLSEDIEQVIVDSYEEYQAISKSIIKIAPHMSACVKHYKESVPIFEYFNIEEELARSLKPKVWLPNGGYLIIDYTEALTVIDVNTGKFIGQRNLEETVLATNIEAAKEVAAQIRLRNLSGIIIVDFIDMHIEENQQKVLQVIEEEFKKDRNKTHVLGITKLGLVEITRKKIRKSLPEAIMHECPTCQGSGRILSNIAIANRIDREIRHFLRHTKEEAIIVEMHSQIISEFAGIDDENLKEMETQYKKSVFLKPNSRIELDNFNIVFCGDEREVKQLLTRTV